MERTTTSDGRREDSIIIASSSAIVHSCPTSSFNRAVACLESSATQGCNFIYRVSFLRDLGTRTLRLKRVLLN